MTGPTVSVVIPVYEGEKTIGQAIDSVIAQTIFKEVDLMVISDASPDNSEKIISSYVKQHSNIRLLVAKKNQGITATQNWASKEAIGEFIARLDQDDRWIDKSKLAKQVRHFRKNSKVGLVGTWAQVKNKTGRDFILKPPTTDAQIRERILMANMFIAPTVMFRRSLVDKLGGYASNLKYGTEDYEYWLRIGTVAELANLGDVTLEYSFSPASYSFKNKLEATKEHLSIVERYRHNYPNYELARTKNILQVASLSFPPLRSLGERLAPWLAEKIYS